ncbi:MAG TPA: LLM class F420-dependent oxidoreductase, partial [Pseudomonadales bacterium]|nr:LLM class F420-dependent oxidoreductase [Pseudomonadales bacterium]
MMKIGLFATFMSPACGPDMVTEFAKNAEEIGIESLWLGEHVVLFDQMEFPYPGSKDGKIPVPAGGGMLDT